MIELLKLIKCTFCRTILRSRDRNVGRPFWFYCSRDFSEKKKKMMCTIRRRAESFRPSKTVAEWIGLFQQVSLILALFINRWHSTLDGFRNYKFIVQNVGHERCPQLELRRLSLRSLVGLWRGLGTRWTCIFVFKSPKTCQLL